MKIETKFKVGQNVCFLIDFLTEDFVAIYTVKAIAFRKPRGKMPEIQYRLCGRNQLYDEKLLVPADFELLLDCIKQYQLWINNKIRLIEEFCAMPKETIRLDVDLTKGVSDGN